LVEGRAHALIESSTFPFLNGIAHFLPNTKLEEVTEKLKLLESDFWQAKEHFLENYTAIRETASMEWRAMASKLAVDPEQVVASIEQSFPLAHTMGKYFEFSTNLFQISLPEKLTMELISTAEQQQIMASRQQAVQEASSKIHRDTEAFVSECIASLREQTAQLCEEMLRSINSSEKGVHQKTLNRLVNFIDQFKQMNFANDTVMERQLEQVRRELLTRTAEEYRGDASATKNLVTGLAQLADQARQLSRQDTSELLGRFGEIGRRKFHLAA
jgi:DNA-binding ferritin-like protein